MKNINFALLFVLSFLITGCSIMPATIEDNGVQIRGRQTVTITVDNESDEWLLVDLTEANIDLRKNYQRVKPHSKKPFEIKVDFHTSIEILHRDQSAKDFIGDSLYKKPFQVGAYADDVITIDNLTLKGKSWQMGFIENLGDPTVASLGDGRSFTLMTNQTVVFKKSSGSYTLTMTPVHDPRNTHGPRTMAVSIDNARNDVEYHPPGRSEPILLDFNIVMREHWTVWR